MPTTTTVPDHPIRTEPPRRSGARWAVFGVALVLTGAALAFLLWDGPAGPAIQEKSTVRPTQQVDRIEIDIEAGDLEVTSGEEVIVDVESRSGRAAHATTTSDVTDGVLSVSVSCPRISLLRSCDTSVNLVVPPGTPVVAATEAGTITASDVTAGADLRVGAGSIDVRDLAGTVRLRSDAGSISGTVLGGTIDASTSAGPILITVVKDLERLTATTETGPVELVVPDATYRVDASSSLGRTDVDVTTTTDASRVIEARSEVGDVTVRTGTPSHSPD